MFRRSRSTLIMAFVSQVLTVVYVQAATRRDITTLSQAELTAYRDAFRQLEASGEYARLAGYHGCPDEYCHNESPYRRFLPWHRAYIVEFERALQNIDSSVALHYWDWTSRDAELHGIASAFTDFDYVSGGVSYPNPLRRFRFNCGGQNRFTTRSPSSSSYLRFLRQQVDSALLETTYDDFNTFGGIQTPHGGLHTWVGSDMGDTTFAAYDPIFWAHHSNVDRQWAAWQESSNGDDPSDTIKALPLRPFGVTVEEVLDYRSLGYDYDRLKLAPTVFQLVASGSTVIKNFEGLKEGESLWLYIHDFPDHPPQSYRIYVFVNQPKATVKDARDDNPHFAGFFGIFGGGSSEREQHKSTILAKPIRILDLTSNVQKLAEESEQQEPEELTITFVATDTTGKSIDPDDIPFKKVSVETEETDRSKRRREGGDRDRKNRGSAAVGSAPRRLASGLLKAKVSTADAHLKSFRGEPVVLVFFKGFGCAHCSQQFDTFARELRDAKTPVLFISSDSEPDAFTADALTPDVVADPNLELFRRYGCYDGEPLHGTLILDKAGDVVWKKVGGAPFMDVKVIVSELKKLS